MTQQYNCPECGSDPFKTKDYDKIVSERLELSTRFKRVLANHGLARAEWELRDVELTEGMKWLQRKTKKQAQVITRLEEKLKKLKQQPYERDKVHESL